MTGKVLGAVAKKALITVSTGVLEGVSYLFDKGAELADEAHDYVEALGKTERDLTEREKRQDKRSGGKTE